MVSFLPWLDRGRVITLEWVTHSKLSVDESWTQTVGIIKVGSVPSDHKDPQWCFGCKERSSHSLLLIVMRCIPSEPAIFHFCCNGTWFSTMPPPPSLKESLSVHVHPLECWNVEIHPVADSQPLLHLSVSSPDEDSCQKFVPFIGVRATWQYLTCLCEVEVLLHDLSMSSFLQVVKVGIVEQSLSTSGSISVAVPDNTCG